MSKSISIYLLTIFIICGFGVLNPVLSDDEDSPLDLGTIKVWGEKFFIHIDITDRVLKYLKPTKDGAILHAKSIHIPKGHYKVGLSIADVNGNKTEKKYRLKVE